MSCIFLCLWCQQHVSVMAIQIVALMMEAKVRAYANIVSTIPLEAIAPNARLDSIGHMENIGTRRMYASVSSVNR